MAVEIGAVAGAPDGSTVDPQPVRRRGATRRMAAARVRALPAVPFTAAL
jgi:hypothetical protein